MHIDHVVLWVEDARRSLEFYTNIVGLPGVRADEFLAGAAPFPSVRISDASMLDLAPAMGAPFARGFTGETKPTAAGQPINHVCLSMSRAEFEALAARLTTAGIAMHKMGERSYGAQGSSKHWFYFQDPDGNVIEARHYELVD
jgi:catechol 2,3-dioxygenase-like lactoylglutathione lyase family enzyme